MTYRLAIFDFDGTLADSLPWFASVFNSVADHFEFKRVDAGELEALRSHDTRALLAHLGLPLWKVPLVASHMRSLAARHAHDLRLFAGVEDTLRLLRDGGVTLAMVSSNAAENIRRVLGPETAARVSHYECGASLFGKPSKLAKVLRASGVPASEAIYVGDEVRDGEAARAAGVAFGAVTWGFNSAQALRAQSPQEVFTRVEEIADRLVGAARA